MTLKDKPTENIYIAAVFYPPTDNLNIHHLANWICLSGGKCTAAVCLDIIIGKDIFVVSTQIHSFEWNYCRYALSGDGWGISFFCTAA